MLGLIGKTSLHYAVGDFHILGFLTGKDRNAYLRMNTNLRAANRRELDARYGRQSLHRPPARSDWNSALMANVYFWKIPNK